MSGIYVGSGEPSTDGSNPVLWCSKDQAPFASPGCAHPAPDVGHDLMDFIESGPPKPEEGLLIPGTLDRGERLGIIGPEGGGKSTLLRQWCVGPAVGIHPLTGQPMPRIRTLLIDLENPRDGLHSELVRLFAPLARANNYERGAMRLYSSPQGMDILNGSDRAALARLMEVHQPDLVALGPIYKAFDGSVDDSTNGAVAKMLDALLAKFQCALVWEGHRPQDSSDGARRRPNGSRVWQRWPDFGYDLGNDGSMKEFRRPRVATRIFPDRLARGVPGIDWPWTGKDVPTTSDAVAKVLSSEWQTTNQITEAVGLDKETVLAVLREWNRLGDIDSHQERGGHKFWRVMPR